MSEQKKKIDYHGYIYMHTLVYFTDDVCYEEGADKVFVEIRLKFTDGVLQSTDWIQPSLWDF